MSLQPPDDPTPGRRDNGLGSAEWGALVDVDPRLSEALLDSLAAEGVPAYVEPALGIDTVSRATTHPSRPLDRLWVDPARADLARGVVAGEVADLTALLAEEEPGATAHGLVHPVPRSAAIRVLAPPVLPGRSAPVPPAVDPPLPARPDDDEVFRQIVAGFGTTSSDPVSRWPVAEDLDPRPPRRTLPPGPVTPHRRRHDEVTDAALPGWLEPDALPDEGHYVPPPPPPVPRLRLRTVASVALMVLGLMLIFVPGLLRLSDTSGVLVLGMACATGGAALLVHGMRDAPPTDRGPDDGAVV